MKKLKQFLKDNLIFGFVVKDTKMKCYYVKMKCKHLWVTEICWKNELNNNEKFESWKKAAISRFRVNEIAIEQAIKNSGK